MQYISPKTIRSFKNTANGHINIPDVIESKCPRCNKPSDLVFEFVNRADTDNFLVVIGLVKCMICKETSTLILMDGEKKNNNTWHNFKELWISPVPKDDREAPEEVDDPELRQKFKESLLCLEVSPSASAVMSRYCLQRILRDKIGTKKARLWQEIKEAIGTENFPEDIEQGLRAIKTAGDWGAHPSDNNKDQEFIDVERKDAELLTDIVKWLLDYYYVNPARRKKRAEEIKEKFK